MKKTNMVKLWFLLGVSMLFIGGGNAQHLEQKIDKLLSTRYKSELSGATALVARNGKVIYRKAFGMANMELGVPMKPEHVFEIGSITKQFTAVGILMLVEQGKLTLNDELTKFIPDYPTHGKKITVHHLLTHTSGIKSYTGMPGLREFAKKDMTPTELIDFFKNEPMDFDPGEAYKYNNSGYILLGYIIEKLTGETYADFIEENIFKKIGMTSSYYGSTTNIIPNRASGYQKGGDNVYRNADYISMTIPYAAGSLMSNVDDMLKWQQAIKNNTLVTQNSINKAFTNYTLNSGKPIDYGYGWNMNEINGAPTIEHGGGIFGYTTQGVYVPEEEVYVIILTNCSCNSPGDTAVRIAAHTIGKPFPTSDVAVNLTDEALKKWAGAYQFDEDITRYITVENNTLYSQREGSRKFKILPKSPNHFFFEGDFSEYEFSEKNGKKMVIMRNRARKSIGVETDKVLPGEKEGMVLTPEILERYAGKYELQPGFVLTVTPKGNRLFAQATGQPEVEVFAENETSFFLKVVQAKIVFNLNNEKQVESLTLFQAGREMTGKKIE